MPGKFASPPSLRIFSEQVWAGFHGDRRISLSGAAE